MLGQYGVMQLHQNTADTHRKATIGMNTSVAQPHEPHNRTGLVHRKIIRNRDVCRVYAVGMAVLYIRSHAPTMLT
eukprot:358445-Chlamydomonas_euryale.AAC.15